MTNTLNKHGPRSDLMQGDGLNRGSPPSCPVGLSYLLVIEPPGYRRRRTVEPVGRTNFNIAGSLIVHGLPVLSHTGLPEYSPPYLTHQPGSQLVTVTVKHNLIDVRGSLCIQQSAFSSQHSAVGIQHCLANLS